MFQLGCWNLGSTLAALSSTYSEIAQSRMSEYGPGPSRFVKFPTPLVVEFTSLNQKLFSVPAGRWSAANRRKLQIAPRVCRSSSNESNPMGAWSSVRCKYVRYRAWLFASKVEYAASALGSA